MRTPQRPVRAYPGVLVRSPERRLGFLVAEGGETLRRLAYIPGDDTEHLELGAPLTYEQERRTALGLPALPAEHLEVDEDDDEWMWELLEMTTRLAGS